MRGKIFGKKMTQYARSPLIRFAKPKSNKTENALFSAPTHPKQLVTQTALATNNAGAEAATEWVFAHMEDADFNDPLPEPGPSNAVGPSSGAGGSSAGAFVYGEVSEATGVSPMCILNAKMPSPSSHPNHSYPSQQKTRTRLPT